MSAGSKSRALTNRQIVMQRKSELTHQQRQERYQMLKNERLRREREEYESLTPEQRRRRDLKDEKKARKGAKGKHKVSLVALPAVQAWVPLCLPFFALWCRRFALFVAVPATHAACVLLLDRQNRNTARQVASVLGF